MGPATAGGPVRFPASPSNCSARYKTATPNGKMTEQTQNLANRGIVRDLHCCHDIACKIIGRSHKNTCGRRNV